MSMELMQKVYADIRDRETAAITARALQLYATEAALLSDENYLKQKAGRFIEVCNKNRNDSNRGFIGRLLRGSVNLRTDHYYDHFEADFVTSLEPMNRWSRRLINEKQPVYPEIGFRTEPFGCQEIMIDDTIVVLGWQAGLVEKRQVHNPSIGHTTDHTSSSSHSVTFIYEDGKQQIEPSENLARPVRIWRVASGIAVDGAEIELREVTHDINRYNGELVTYVRDLQDDEVLGFPASMFAIGLLQNAIEFVER